MNFQEFYKKTENRLTDAILSLWATGDKEMQDYLNSCCFKNQLWLMQFFSQHFLGNLAN